MSSRGGNKKLASLRPSIVFYFIGVSVYACVSECVRWNLRRDPQIALGLLRVRVRIGAATQKANN
jgi:hypothetical protein